MAAELAKAYVQIIPSAQGIQGSISSVLGGESTSAGEQAGTNMASAMGKKLKGALVGLGIGKMFMDAVGDASEFESSMAKVSTLFTGDADQFANLQSEILNMSSAYGLGATTLAEAAYSAESAGVPMEQLTEMLSGSAKLAMAGFTDVDTALSATAKTMNAYGDAAGSVEDIQKVLIQTQNLGITTVGELGASLANVTPTAAAMGVSFDQVGAALAQMTASGVPTAQATTQLRSAMTELGKAGTKADKAFRAATEGTKYAGMGFKEAMASGANLGDVFGLMQSYADATGVSMVDLWGSVEAGNAAMLIAGDVNKFNSNLSQMAAESDVVGEAYGKMSKTFGTSMNRLKESAKNFMTALFTGGDISSSFDSLLESLGDIGGKLIEWVTNGLTALGQNLPNLVNSLLDFGGSLLDALGKVDWIQLGTTILQGIVGALGSLGSRLIELIGSGISGITNGSIDFASVGTAIWNGVTSVITTAGGWLKTLFDTAKNAVTEIDFSGIGSKIKSGVNAILGAGGDFLSAIFTAGKDAVETAAAKDWPSVGDAIKTAVNLALNGGAFLSEVFSAGAELIKGINWTEVGTHAESLIVAGLDGAATLVETISGAAQELLDGVEWQSVGQSAGELLCAGLEGAADIVGAVTTAASDLISGIEWDSIGQSAGELLTAGIEGATSLVQTISTAADELLTGIQWGQIGTEISGLLEGGIEGASQLLQDGFSAAHDFITGISWSEIGGAISDGVTGTIDSAGDFLKAPFEAGKALIEGIPWAEVGAKISGGLGDVWDGLTGFVGGLLGSAGDVVSGAGSAVKGIGEGVGAFFKNLFSGDDAKAAAEDLKKMMEDLEKAISDGEQSVVTTAENASKKIRNGINSELTAGKMNIAGQTAGAALVRGIIVGVQTQMNALIVTMQMLAAVAVGAVKAALGIASPSAVMRDQVGKWIPAGIAEGIGENGDMVDDAMREMSADLAATDISGIAVSQGRSLGSLSAQGRNGESGNGDIIAAIQGLRNDMTNIRLVVGQKVFGRAVTEYGGRRIDDYIGGAESRLAAGYGT